MEQDLKLMEKQFIDVYDIPKAYIDYDCGAEDDDEDCPDEDTDCKDCPYKTIVFKETEIQDYQWVELIAICGNKQMLHFPYRTTTDLKKHVLQLVINSHKYPPIVKDVKKLFSKLGN